MSNIKKTIEDAMMVMPITDEIKNHALRSSFFGLLLTEKFHSLPRVVRPPGIKLQLRFPLQYYLILLYVV